MIEKNFVNLMANFGMVCSLTRQRVSHNHQFNERQFKTLKTSPAIWAASRTLTLLRPAEAALVACHLECSF